MRRAGSPVQVSSRPRMANFTPAWWKSWTRARTTRWFRSTRAPPQPTQSRTSIAPAASMCGTGTGNPSVQSIREKRLPANGCPRASSEAMASCIVSGNSASSITRYRRRSTILGIGSIITGHASMHAAHVVQAHKASGSSAGVAPMIGADRSVCWCESRCRSRIRSRGESDLPTWWAGQAAVQRPHSVQESKLEQVLPGERGQRVDAQRLRSVEVQRPQRMPRPAPGAPCTGSAAPSRRGPSLYTAAQARKPNTSSKCSHHVSR